MPIAQVFVREAGGNESALQASQEHRFQQCCLYGKDFFILGKEKKREKGIFPGESSFQDSQCIFALFRVWIRQKDIPKMEMVARTGE